MEYKVVDLSRIRPNVYNPNEMNAKIFKHLKQEIQRIGIVQPLLLREIGNSQYEIVDGEHRYKASMESGITAVPAIIFGKDEIFKDVNEAKLATVNLKAIQGEFNPMKYAMLLSKLESSITREEIKKYLDVCDTELEHAKRLINVEDSAIPIPRELTGNEATKIFSFKIVGDQNCQMVNKYLYKCGWAKNRDMSFLILCQRYIEMEKELERL